jgi:hypothetical protein
MDSTVRKLEKPKREKENLEVACNCPKEELQDLNSPNVEKTAYLYFCKKHEKVRSFAREV